MFSGIRAKDFFKITAVLVASVFFWNQLAWAMDLRNDPSKKENIPGTAVQEFLENRNRQEALIEQKKDVENFQFTQNPASPGGDYTTFYAGSPSRVETREVLDDDPSSEFYGSRVKYYHYDEEEFTDGTYTCGRIYRVDVTPVSGDYSTDSAYSYEIVYDEDPGQTTRITSLARKDLQTGEDLCAGTYFDNDSNRVESITVYYGDGLASVTYYYKDEDYEGTGCGRVERVELSEPRETGESVFSYEYEGATDVVREVTSYTSPTSDTEALYNIYSYTYEPSSGSLSAIALEHPDDEGNIAYHYDTVSGTVNKLVKTAGYGDVRVIEIHSYHSGTDAVKEVTAKK